MSIIFCSCRKALCRMSILRNGRVALSNLRVKGHYRGTASPADVLPVQKGLPRKACPERPAQKGLGDPVYLIWKRGEEPLLNALFFSSRTESDGNLMAFIGSLSEQAIDFNVGKPAAAVWIQSLMLRHYSADVLVFLSLVRLIWEIYILKSLYVH